MPENITRPRYFLLDELRGLAIIAMVIYHAFFLLAEVFDNAGGWALLTRAQPWQPFIPGTFILLCGVCCQFSRSNGKRGLRLLGAAALVTLCTWALGLFGMDLAIWFGVLHFLAAAVLLFALLQKPLAKLPPLPQILVFLALFFASAGLLFGGRAGLGFGRHLLPFPMTKSFPLFILGFPSRTLTSADYFPLIPWLFLFLAGTAIGVYGRQGRFPAFFAKSRIPPLQWLGRHSLLLYLLHQPVLLGIMLLVFGLPA